MAVVKNLWKTQFIEVTLQQNQLYRAKNRSTRVLIIEIVVKHTHSFICKHKLSPFSKWPSFGGVTPVDSFLVNAWTGRQDIYLCVYYDLYGF